MTNPQLARLHEYLAKLKLVTIQARLETFLQDASAQEVTYADFLDRLLAEEVAAKSDKYVAMRTVMARFPIVRRSRALTSAFSLRSIARRCRSWLPVAARTNWEVGSQ